jgi:signal peptidase I
VNDAQPPATREPQSSAPGEHHLNLLGVMQGLMTIVVVAVFVLTFLVQPFRIPSESMEPTLLIGDFVLVDKVTLAPAGAWHWLLPYRNVQRGEVIVFRRDAQPAQAEEDAESYLVKRIVAIPGDHVRLDDGHLLLNGTAQSEPYAILLPSGPDAFRDDFPASMYTDVGVDSGWWVQMHRLVRDGALIVPEHDYFALGDNRNHSQDSRYWGFVDRQQMVGPVLLIYFSVRTPSPDDVELARRVPATGAAGANQQGNARGVNGTMSKRLLSGTQPSPAPESSPSGLRKSVRWGRILQVVR